MVEKSVLVGYPAEQMFALIDAVEAYPQFLPWCAGSEVDHRDSQITRATLRIDFRSVRQSFTTENRKSAPDRISMRLVEGPFRLLDGVWEFKALGNAACRIDFRLRYEFSTRLLERLVGPVFNHIADTMVDAFVRRAETLYGP